ncbi:nitroreductase family protein [Agromyces sp. LHK192]|uniref:nitroreductase family protein n=1 Tax=Agromyces sp. LHK192 TaxID=2498704 RepID=UPI000FDC872F|nr:nitroreductase family protein [Agromyces sp. LHK192]
MASAFEAALSRRSSSKVTDAAPDDAELTRMLGAAGRVADHAGLRPWRVIALRGAARGRLGDALVEASASTGEPEHKLAGKPLRAPLLLAVVATITEPHKKVPAWEQEAVASGVAHVLSLLLDDAGWGVMWRTGPYTRHPAVARMHDLAPGELLLGWLYVGGRAEHRRPGRPADVARRFSVLD